MLATPKITVALIFFARGSGPHDAIARPLIPNPLSAPPSPFTARISRGRPRRAPVDVSGARQRRPGDARRPGLHCAISRLREIVTGVPCRGSPVSDGQAGHTRPDSAVRINLHPPRPPQACCGRADRGRATGAPQGRPAETSRSEAVKRIWYDARQEGRGGRV